MGNIPSNHVRIWNEVSRLENNGTRLTMMETLLNGPEYIKSMKTMEIYADIMTWMAMTRRGINAQFPKIKSPVQTSQTNQSTALAKQAPAKRAMDYLHEAYDLLGLSDNEALTAEALKIAYKRSALKAHPDKGGSPAKFDAVTKAFLYLQEVYNKLTPKGVRPDMNVETVTMESAIKYRNDPKMPNFDDSGINLVVREEQPKAAIKEYRDPDSPKNAPILINPKKIDMNIFNQLFEQNKLPDPEKDDGYGDWLKEQDIGKRNSNEMRGKFNIDVFNKTFDTESQSVKSSKDNTVAKFKHPDALMLTPTAVVLGGEKPAEYTAPTGSRMQYTDLKAAYSTHMTFSQEVKDVKFDAKSFAQAKAEREKAPESVSKEEMEHIEMLRYNTELNERNRQLRLSSRDTDGERAQERLKQRLLITQKPLS